MEDIKYTKTELHTHLVGMLSLKDFVAFIESFYIFEVRLPSGEVIRTRDMLSDQYCRFFCIPSGEQADYKVLEKLYLNRTLILNNIGPTLRKRGVFPSNNVANKVVFNRLINASLKSLIKQGIKYVEISYSFPDRISDFKIYEDYESKIKCRFLLSTNRKNAVKSDDKSIQTFEKSARDLKKIIDGPNDVGFDIMGEETVLTDNELDYNDSFNSFERKMEVLIMAMMDENHEVKKDTVLRIHSGETPWSTDNTINTLRMLKSIEARNGIKIPPPEIRIGHGIHFVKSDEYIALLKDLKCVIEINASSNMALSNVRSTSDIPYDYYIQNGIPIVISTDGEGLYSTSVIREDYIAHEMSGASDYETILNTDQDVLDRKVR